MPPSVSKPSVRRQPSSTARSRGSIDSHLVPAQLAPSPSAPAPSSLWIHLYDPHAPYNPPREFVRATAERTATVEERYDGEVRYTDAQIARVLAWLDAHALRDRTLVVVAGDHGEGLGDHGERTHGMLLYDSTLRVPLIVSMPGVAAAKREPVSLADIAPTMLRATGVAVPPAMKGRDLLAGVPAGARTLTAGRETRTYECRRAATCTLRHEYPRVAGWSPLQALTDGRWMAISGAGATALYDLQNDPREERDVSAAQPSVTAALASRIDAIRRRAARPAGARDFVRRRATPAFARLRRQFGPAVAWRRWTASGREDRRVESVRGRARALNSGQAAAAATALTKLAATNPDAPVFQTTYARALAESGQAARALEVYRRRGAALADRRAAPARSRGRRARGGGQSVGRGRQRAASTRRLAPIGPRWCSRPTARSRTTAWACSRSTEPAAGCR